MDIEVFDKRIRMGHVNVWAGEHNKRKARCQRCKEPLSPGSGTRSTVLALNGYQSTEGFVCASCKRLIQS